MITLKDIKNNVFNKENIYFLVLILFIFFLDRYSKNQILNNFNESKFYINDYFNFDLTWNTGIGFGLLSTEMNIIYNFVNPLTFFILLTFIKMLALIIFFIYYNQESFYDIKIVVYNFFPVYFLFLSFEIFSLKKTFNNI